MILVIDVDFMKHCSFFPISRVQQLLQFKTQFVSIKERENQINNFLKGPKKLEKKIWLQHDFFKTLYVNSPKEKPEPLDCTLVVGCSRSHKYSVSIIKKSLFMLFSVVFFLLLCLFSGTETWWNIMSDSWAESLVIGQLAVWTGIWYSASQLLLLTVNDINACSKYFGFIEVDGSTIYYIFVCINDF